MAILEYGLLSAIDRGEVTPEQLRFLFQDPELIESLHDRVIEEGNPDLWFPAPRTAVASDDFAALAEAFFEAMASSAATREWPRIECADSQRTFNAVRVKERGGWRLSIRVPIIEDTVLTLRLMDRSWGKISVKRKTAIELEIPARTGVFLAYPVPSSLRIRAAAEVPVTESALMRSSLNVRALVEGLQIDITLAT